MVKTYFEENKHNEEECQESPRIEYGAKSAAKEPSNAGTVTFKPMIDLKDGEY